MSVPIDDADLEPVTINRNNERLAAKTVVLSNVRMAIQDDTKPAFINGVFIGAQETYRGFVRVPLSGVQLGDEVTRTGKTPAELYVTRIFEQGDVQEFVLTETQRVV